jgi:branched-chain amino acid transport system permease protein
MSMVAAQTPLLAKPPVRMLLAVGIAAVLVTLPLWSPSNYVTGVATLALFFAVASTGLNIVYGYAGLLSFAQVGFWGLGAYTSALLVADLGVSPWIGVVASGLVCTAAALLAGLAALRVSRDAFVVITLSFTLLLQLLARSWTSFTRGAMGIPGLSAPDFDVPGILSLNGSESGDFYWITLIFATIVLGIVWQLLRSRIGRAFVAVNLDENLARSQGLSARRLQLIAFALSAMIGGLAGGLYVFKLGIVDPGIFDIYYAQMMLIIVIVGGAGHFWSVIVMSFVFAILPEVLRLAPELRMVLFGLVLIITIQFMPQGFAGLIEQHRNRALRRGE